MSKLRDVLEQIERHGELRDMCGTRYQTSRLLAPAIRRQLICVEPRRGRYELTPAGRQRLDRMRARAPRQALIMRCAVVASVMSLVVAGLWLAGLRLRFDGPPRGSATAMVRAIDDLKGSLPGDADQRPIKSQESTRPGPTPDQPDPSAVDGSPANPAAPGDDAIQRGTAGAKKGQRAPGRVDRRERADEPDASRLNGTLRGRSADAWPAPPNPYRDERYPTAR